MLELTDREPRGARSRPRRCRPRRRVAVVALEGVTARYGPGERPALAGFDLRLEPGRRVALVGPSGAGKTTVTNLLLRFLDPEEGRVTIAGRDLREYRQEDVRRYFALAGQEAHVFDSTIRENLRLARPTAADAELEAALRRARIGEWVASLPGRPRHARRRGGDAALGRPAPAPHARARSARRRARARARRADRAPRPGDRASRSWTTCSTRPAIGPSS